MDYEIHYIESGGYDHYTLYTKDAIIDKAYESDREGDAEMEIHEHSAIQRIKKKGDHWVLHCLTAPAFVIVGSYYQYFVDGEETDIESMPISDEEKVILMLKYGA